MTADILTVDRLESRRRHPPTGKDKIEHDPTYFFLPLHATFLSNQDKLLATRIHNNQRRCGQGGWYSCLIEGLVLVRLQVVRQAGVVGVEEHHDRR